MTETVFLVVDTDDPVQGERQVNTVGTEETAVQKADNLAEALPGYDREDFEIREVEAVHE